MAKLNRKEIQDGVLSLLEKAPEGMRWTHLLHTLQADHPETPPNSIHGATHHLLNSDPKIVKIARGIYQLAKYRDDEDKAAQDEVVAQKEIQVELPGHIKVTLLESDFYESFAAWLTETDEVNMAVALGGNALKGKWGTPDVLGVLKSRAQDILKFETQIVSAEIKIDPGQPVVAFGQAVAYRLFSHKSYIVVPRTTTDDDLDRLKALCTIHGVGLVTFTLNKATPDYSQLVLPAQASPDMFFANQMLRRLLETSPTLFNKLFS